MKRVASRLAAANKRVKEDQVDLFARIFHEAFVKEIPVRATTYDGVHPDIQRAIKAGIRAVLEKVEAGP